MPQTPPMSIGSAFDARVKSWLIKRLSLDDNGGQYGFEALFEKQVEPHNRDWALAASEWCMAQYQSSGALLDLVRELALAVEPPRFEFGVDGKIKTSFGEVPITGRPDIYFKMKSKRRVLLDWKVNGFCSNSPTTPAPGYVKCRDSWSGGAGYKPTRNNLMPHPNAFPQLVDGVLLSAVPLENVDGDWATQLITYAWLLGERVGEDDGLIIGIEQLVGVPREGQTYPHIRVATHRSFCTHDFQMSVLDMYRACWQALQEGHIFTTLPKGESLAKQQELDKTAQIWCEHNQLGPDAPFSLSAWVAGLILN
jgi:hypothetical protein